MESSYSLQFNHSVKSDSLQPHGLQHTSLPVLHQLLEFAQILVHWVDDATKSSHALSFPSPCFQPFPASRSFPISQFFPSDGQSIGASASALVLPKNIHDRFTIGLTGLISLQSKGLSRVFSNTTVKSINSSTLSLLYGPTLTSILNHWENHSFD